MLCYEITFVRTITGSRLTVLSEYPDYDQHERPVGFNYVKIREIDLNDARR